jgi:hypothetical protein
MRVGSTEVGRLRVEDQLEEAVRLLEMLSEADLSRLALSAGSGGYWSRLLVGMIRAEIERRRA